MKKNVVYILGAGFSAPLGIPVMRNFVEKARQIKRGNAKYDYFGDLINLIQGTVTAVPYFSHDPDNIEEALSLLEMKDVLDASNTRGQLVSFITDIIKHTTPPIPNFQIDKMQMNMWQQLFTNTYPWAGYCSFVAIWQIFDLPRQRGMNREALRSIQYHQI